MNTKILGYKKWASAQEEEVVAARQKVIKFLNWTSRSCQFGITVLCLPSIVMANVMTVRAR